MNVIYIAGHGRSGTTLLDLALGIQTGFFSVGEVRQVFRRGFTENQLCGCGEKLLECAFWRSVATDLLGDPTPEAIEKITRLQDSVDRSETFLKTPMFLPSRFASRFQRLRCEYTERLRDLFHAVREHSNASVIVDSSKAPSHGFLLSDIETIQLVVVHIVRDPRAVAHSLQRRRLRPEIHWKREYMPTYPPHRTAIRWILMNRLAERLGKRASRYFRIRYEDLAEDPGKVLGILLSALDIPEDQHVLPDGNTLHLGEAHTVSGNPVRMKKGVMRVALDDEWIDRMPAFRKAVVTTLSAPWLLRYRYHFFPGRKES